MIKARNFGIESQAFHLLHDGDTFEYDKRLYIKISEIYINSEKNNYVDLTYNCVDLLNGKLSYFEYGDFVFKVNVDCVVEYIK